MCAGTPSTVLEIGEGQHRAENLDVQRRANVDVGRRALPDHAAQIQDLQPLADRDRLGHDARISLQRVAMAQHADDHVAVVQRDHPPVHVFELVVDALFAARPGRDDVALVGRDFRHHADFPPQRHVPRGRGDLVNPQSHWRLPSLAARWDSASARP